MSIPDCTSVSSDWTCLECKKKLRKLDNSNSRTPVQSVSAIPPPCEGDESPLIHPPQHKELPSDDSEIRAMRSELAAFISEQRDFRKEVRASLANLVGRVDGIERRLEAVELREATALSSPKEVIELQQSVLQLKLDLNDRDQDLLLTDLDIGHLPEEKGENVVHTVTVVAAKLGIRLEERDIVFAERVGVAVAGEGTADGGLRVRPRRVVVRLARRHLRDEILSAARVRRNFSSADIGLVGPSRRIYINERLTRSNRKLFHRVREECRKCQWRYSWTKRGRVFARQADGKPAYSFRAETDVARVFGATNV